jgi:hypothetical protein
MWTDEGVEVLQRHEIPNIKEGGADADLKVQCYISGEISE